MDDPETYRTRSGKILSDAEIQALADEAEGGYDIRKLPRSHRCPHPACTRRVRGGYLSCAAHWFELPVGLRLEIYRAFEAEPGGEAHQAAIAQAITFWRA